MKIPQLGRAVAFLVVVTTSSAHAEPISLRGIDWSMSQAEQIAALENAGTDYVQEAG